MFIVVIVILLLYFLLINPIILENTQVNLDKLAKRAINLSVEQVTSNKVIYDDLINISYSNTGDISFIQVKTFEANKVCNDIILTTEENIDKLGSSGFDIKGGLFTGIPILSGIGNNINFKFGQVGAVTCVYYSKFDSAGINQNIHQLYVDINAKVSVIFPFNSQVVDVSQRVLLCENIIIGKIPDTYLQSTELDSLLNLVPS